MGTCAIGSIMAMSMVMVPGCICIPYVLEIGVAQRMLNQGGLPGHKLKTTATVLFGPEFASVFRTPEIKVAQIRTCVQLRHNHALRLSTAHDYQHLFAWALKLPPLVCCLCARCPHLVSGTKSPASDISGICTMLNR